MTTLLDIANSITLSGGKLSSGERYSARSIQGASSGGREYLSQEDCPSGNDNCDCVNCPSDCYCTDCNEGHCE